MNKELLREHYIVCLFVVIFESVFDLNGEVLRIKFNVQEVDDAIEWINAQKSWATLLLQSVYILLTWLVFRFAPGYPRHTLPEGFFLQVFLSVLNLLLVFVGYWSGFVNPLYPDGHQGLPNWEEEELTDMTRKANANGITMHTHVMGNKGVNRIVNAFVGGGKDEMRNTLVHVRNVDAADYQRMADHNIYVTSGMLWHNMPDEYRGLLRELVPAGMEDKSYPMKSFFDYGINLTSHSDYPALSGSPDDPFGIMEIAVNGVMAERNDTPWWPEELLTREQALQALTINCARQMFIDDVRGSIKAGKYADFLLLNKDVLSCPVTEIHEAKPAATYFEGKKVFAM